jgi:peptidoglycan/LPS O-acetylase OafA/YrhL
MIDKPKVEPPAVPSQRADGVLHIQGRTVSDHLNLVRGLAAVAVLVYHVRYRFFFDYKDLSTKDPLSVLFYAATSFGHDAVMVFFVLSGYFIPASVLRDDRSGRWSWGRYGLNRLVRLYVVLIPGLLLTLAWDSLGLSLYPSHPIYSGEKQTWIHDYFRVEDREGARVFFANLAFLQMIFVPPFGSDEPLWSLTNEFWYYVLFPLLFFGIFSRGKWIRAIAFLCLSGFLLRFVGDKIALYFPIWLLGAVICFLPQIPGLRRKLPSWLVVVLFGVFCCVLALTHAGMFKANVKGLAESILSGVFHVDTTVHPQLVERVVGLVGDYVIGISFAILLYILLHDQTPQRKGVYGWCTEHLAGISFTLYVVHMPLLVFLRAALVPGRPWSPDMLHIGFAGGLTILMLAYAWLIAQVTEARTDVVRRWVSDCFKARRILLPTVVKNET